MIIQSIIFILFLNFYSARAINFTDNNNKNHKFTKITINEKDYILLDSLRKKFNFKIFYNRVLHKLSFTHVHKTVLMSPLLDSFIINESVYKSLDYLKFVNGKFYISVEVLEDEFYSLFKLKQFKKLVFIDPGHGGSDLGAVVKQGTKDIYEKDIVLNFSKLLKNELISKGYEVQMSRTDDKRLNLKERIESANYSNALSFISIHANFSKLNNMAEGFEVYYLSETASDTHSHIVAIAENNVFSKEKLSKSSDIKNILQSMFISSHINESTKLAYLISTQVKTTANRGVKKAPFYVLAGTYMPSVLVELGFMSNKKELSNLTKKEYLKTLAQEIARGVVMYTDTVLRSKEDEV